MNLSKYPKGSEAEQTQKYNEAFKDLFRQIQRENNTTTATNNLKELFKEIGEKKVINKEILKLIKDNLVGYDTQKHVEKGLNNFLQLPKEVKENLGKLVKIFDNIDWGIIGGLGIKESKFEIKAESSKGAKGIFQVKIFESLKKHFNSTNKYKGKEEKFLSDLKNNQDFLEVYKKIPREALGVAFLSYLIDKYDGDLIKAYGYYNSGQDNYSNWGKETKEYVYGEKSVLKYGKVFYLAINQLK